MGGVEIDMLAIVILSPVSIPDKASLAASLCLRPSGINPERIGSLMSVCQGSASEPCMALVEVELYFHGTATGSGGQFHVGGRREAHLESRWGRDFSSGAPSVRIRVGETSAVFRARERPAAEPSSRLACPIAREIYSSTSWDIARAGRGMYVESLRCME